MLSYQNLCVTHARLVNNILSDEYYQQATDLNKTLKIGGIMKGNQGVSYSKYAVYNF